MQTFDVLETAGLLLGQAAPGAAQPPGWTSFIPLVIMFALFYFVLIRPQMKRQKEHAALIKSVKTGDEVIAAGGIYGQIANVKDESVILKIADNVKIEVQRASIITVKRDGDKASS